MVCRPFLITLLIYLYIHSEVFLNFWLYVNLPWQRNTGMMMMVMLIDDDFLKKQTKLECSVEDMV